MTAPPEAIGPYTVIGVAEGSGPCVAYLCRSASGDLVKVKRFEQPPLANPAPQLKWSPELDALVALRHPGILGTLEVAHEPSTAGFAFIAEEFFEAQSLWQMCTLTSGFLTMTRRLPIKQTARILYHVAQVLDSAHAAGIIHGALEPGAILVKPHSDAKDSPVTVRLSNFVISSMGLTETQQLALAAMDACSPEKVRQMQVSANSDQFSLAAIAYWSLTGVKPFSEELRSPCGFPGGLRPTDAAHPDLRGTEHILRRAMDPNPLSRYGSCMEFVQQLVPVLVRAEASGSAAPSRAISVNQIIGERPAVELPSVLDVAISVGKRLLLMLAVAAAVVGCILLWRFGSYAVDWIRDRGGSP